MAQYLMPVISAVALSPNPVDFSAALLIQVTISDEYVELPPEERYSGEFYSGEV